ncbi:unnamed protein product [Cylicocyclus nassatus]|uniref:STPR domain-containing protein n=1 Tax=Cylicocyclus nassatus TaxID=53992 RepID=A0AA36DW66_CYLNA|nr:unnamed protein product [Cylicocyclus nassatus]
MEGLTATQIYSPEQIAEDASTSTADDSTEPVRRSLTKAEREAHRRSNETQIDRHLRLAAKKGRAASRKSNETKDERTLRLKFDAERARQRRLAETEEKKSERLAKDAERARKRRLTVSEKNRMLEPCTGIDMIGTQSTAASPQEFEDRLVQKRSRTLNCGEQRCLVSCTCGRDGCEYVFPLLRPFSLAPFQQSNQESTCRLLIQKETESAHFCQRDSAGNESNYLKIPLPYSVTTLSENTTTQVMEESFSDMDVHASNFAGCRKFIRGEQVQPKAENQDPCATFGMASAVNDIKGFREICARSTRRLEQIMCLFADNRKYAMQADIPII